MAARTLVLGGTIAAAIQLAVVPTASQRAVIPTGSQPGTLSERLETVRAAADVPAIGGATFRSSGVIATAASGVRRLGETHHSTLVSVRQSDN